MPSSSCDVNILPLTRPESAHCLTGRRTIKKFPIHFVIQSTFEYIYEPQSETQTKVMTQAEKTTRFEPNSLAKRMLIGGTIGLVLMSLFLFNVREPNPEWGKYWMIRPLLMLTFAGAMGGLCYHYISNFRALVGISKPVALIVSFIIFIVGLWMGFVLGLNGTLWN
jgi:hypothetical protein